MNNKKVCLVIGASGGIGKAITKKMLNKDQLVCGTYYQAEKDQLDNEVDMYKLDVTNEDEVRTMIKQIIEKYDRIDSVVYCPTKSTKHTRLDNLEWESFKEHLDVQVKGFFGLVKEMVPQIKSHPVRFVVVLTEYCIGAPPAGVSDYVCAKYGLMGLAKAMSVELAKYSSTVNMVSPGMTETSLLSNLPPKLIEITAQKNPLKRIASPEDVAVVVQFLLSDETSYLNGVNIPINGGGRII